jgi:hypothetical protein
MREHDHRPHWDPLWPGSLERAVKRLGFEFVKFNEGIFFRTQEERDVAVEVAEQRWHQGVARPERR